ncbi:hypothetical protein KIN20_004960 [Parelaphostrongylus tenuis]|uniref:Uncharacterized protein n=1 Tax=Parelaphostrongylus tenuis TaxID=148309 RepID=A0AAD5M3U7_PARTN|nr:hypothetical protein KIN20_004960 [Parelaphostrongylus tenuis]
MNDNFEKKRWMKNVLGDVYPIFGLFFSKFGENRSLEYHCFAICHLMPTDSE